LNSGEKLFFGRGNYFTFPDNHPNGWTVRKPRGTPRDYGDTSDDELIGVLGGWQRIESWAAAGRLSAARVAAQLASSLSPSAVGVSGSVECPELSGQSIH